MPGYAMTSWSRSQTVIVCTCAQGFRDDAYKRRRVAIADLARDHVV